MKFRLSFSRATDICRYERASLIFKPQEDVKFQNQLNDKLRNTNEYIHEVIFETGFK